MLGIAERAHGQYRTRHLRAARRRCPRLRRRRKKTTTSEGSRLPLLIVIALFVLAAFAGVVWLAYTQGVARGRSDVPRIIVAQTGPGEGRPPMARQNATPYKGLKIYEQPAPSDEDSGQQAAPPRRAPRQKPLPVTPPARRRRQIRDRSRRSSAALSVPKSNTPPRRRIAGAAHAGAPRQPRPSRPSPTEAVRAVGLPPPSHAPSAPAMSLQIGAYKSQAEAERGLADLSGQARRCAVRLFAGRAEGRSGRQGHLVSPARRRLCRQGCRGGALRPS